MTLKKSRMGAFAGICFLSAPFLSRIFPQEKGRCGENQDSIMRQVAPIAAPNSS
jgi:hypothetical protein